MLTHFRWQNMHKRWLGCARPYLVYKSLTNDRDSSLRKKQVQFNHMCKSIQFSHILLISSNDRSMLIYGLIQHKPYPNSKQKTLARSLGHFFYYIGVVNLQSFDSLSLFLGFGYFHTIINNQDWFCPKNSKFGPGILVSFLVFWIKYVKLVKSISHPRKIMFS